MDPVREAISSLRSTADLYFDKTTTLVSAASRAVSQQYDAVKARTQVFFETGIAHYHQTEEMILGQFKGGLSWLAVNQGITVVLGGITAIILLPTLRRAAARQLFRPFRSDESIYRSAEGRLQAVQENLKNNQARSEKLGSELTGMLEAFTSAQKQLKTTSQELNSFSSKIHRDVRTTQELVRDMKEMPSRPSLKMQSEAAMTLSALERQNRQVDDLLYRVMQKGI